VSGVRGEPRTSCGLAADCATWSSQLALAVVSLERRCHLVVTTGGSLGVRKTWASPAGPLHQRALATDPRVLLLDEPLAALDPQLRDELRAELAELLRNAGRATVLVTHDQHEALALADRIAIMRDGKVVQCATPSEIWRHPADSFVASFVSRGTVLGAHDAGDGYVVVEGGWRLAKSQLDGGDAIAHGHRLEVVLRPRDLMPDPEGDLILHVRQCEYLGDVVRVHGCAPGSDVRLTCELPASTRISDIVRLSPMPGKVTLRHVRDESGR